jgi:endonuclease G, mitochondrial
MKKTYLIFLFLFVRFGLAGQLLLPSTTTNWIIEHSYFTLSYSVENKQAEWVYYVLTANMLNGRESRKDKFRPDPKITQGSATLRDYRNSGYDRGHLCPAADMKISATAMSETFYLSNMSPQDPSFNRGIWSSLESVVRNWAATNGKIYVVTGGILTYPRGTVGSNRVTVPNHFYKVVYAPDQEKMIALVLPNEKATKHLREYVVSVDSVEKLTGIDFFASLDTLIQSRLESESNHTLWSFEGYRTTPANSEETTMPKQCIGIAITTNERCRNTTTNSNGFCTVHKSQTPDYINPASTVKWVNSGKNNKAVN